MLTPPRFPKLPRPSLVGTHRENGQTLSPNSVSPKGLQAAGGPRNGSPLGATAWRSQRRIHDPCVRHSDIGRRIPITVLIKTGVKAVAVGDVYDLRELDCAIGCD